MKSQSTRPAIFVLLAVVLSAPTLVNVISGNDSATSAGFYLAAAIILAWAAVSGVGQLVDNYRAHAAHRAQGHPQQGPAD